MKHTILKIVVLILITNFLPFSSHAYQISNDLVCQQSGVEDEGKSNEIGNKTGSVTEDQEKIGEKWNIENELKEAILKAEKVLLKRDNWEIDIGILFSTQKEQYLTFVDHEGNFTIGLEEEIEKTFISNLRINYGLTDDLEVYLNFPGIYKTIVKNLENDSYDYSTTGLGDISGGVRYQIYREKDVWPDIMLNFGIKTPSGKDPYEISSPNKDVPLGNGHWETSIGFSLAKSSDPAVLFGGLGFTYSFPRNIRGIKIKTGKEINANFGIAFAINNQISLSFQTTGSYISAQEADNNKIGRSLIPISLNNGLTYTLSKSKYIRWSVGFGLTEDAADSVISISLSNRF